jgi:very-short-patch-repair endonuclease
VRNQGLINRARRQRKAPTIAERALWDRLRAHRLEGLGFRRQADVTGYLVDFFCHDRLLIVEIDGPVHDDGEQQAFDAERDEALQAKGYAVLRIKERMVRLYIDDVAAKIADVAAILARGRALAKSDLRFG